MCNLATKVDYFTFLISFVSDKDGMVGGVSYRDLLHFLYETAFTPEFRYDWNCSIHGVALRDRYEDAFGMVVDGDRESCSMLELLVSLAEAIDSVLYEPKIGDRVHQWFWAMVRTLGLGGMYDNNFDKTKANDIVHTFNDREYEPDGRGGLFYIRSSKKDLREVDIWTQACWYMDRVVGY